MTRKDYIAIAEAFQRTIFRCDGGPGEQAVLDAAGLVADTMADDNPHFNREHFLAVVRGERSLTSRPPRKPIHPDALVRDDSEG